jgi:GntR family transcriptional regulator
MSCMIPCIMPSRSPLTLSRPLYEELRACLLEPIAQDRWKVGETIPTESALASEFRVSVGTVRKAVDALVAGGVLLRRQGKGTFVAAHDARRAMFHFFHIVRREGEKVYPKVRTLAFRRERADTRVARDLAIPRAEPVICIRNLLTLAGTPVIVDDITLPMQLFPGLSEEIFTTRSNTIYHLYQSRYGINVIRTDEKLRAVSALPAQARLLHIPAGSPLLEIRRIALSCRDRRVELRISTVNTAAHDYHNIHGKGEALVSYR